MYVRQTKTTQEVNKMSYRIQTTERSSYKKGSKTILKTPHDKKYPDVIIDDLDSVYSSTVRLSAGEKENRDVQVLESPSARMVLRVFKGLVIYPRNLNGKRVDSQEVENYVRNEFK